MTRRPGRPRGLIADGPEIYRLRVEVHGLSAAELAARVGFSDASIWSAERSAAIGDVFASRLAKALGVEIGAIARRPEPKALAS